MKKILTILFVLSCLVGYGQYPKQLNAYNPLTQVNFLGGIGLDSSLAFRHNYPDTATVNLGFIKNIPNVVVLVNDTLRKRSNDVTRWDNLGGGAVPVTIYTGDGSFPTNRAIDASGNSFSIMNADSITFHFTRTGSILKLGGGNNQSALHFLAGSGGQRFDIGDQYGGYTLDAVDSARFIAGNYVFKITNQGIFKIWDGTNQFVSINDRQAIFQGAAGLANTVLNMDANSGVASFSIEANDSSKMVKIRGDANANSITYTSASDIFTALSTSVSPLVTTGARQGIISDANGLLSFIDKTFGTLPYSASIDWDYTTGFNQTVTLTGDASLIFSNVQDGDQGTLVVIQDGTGSHALTVPDVVITLNTNPGDTTVLGWINQGGVYLWASSAGGGGTSTLPNGDFFVGNVSNVATAVAPTGDVTFNNAGVFTIGASKVTNSMLAGSIDITKISMNTSRVLGRTTGSSGAVEELTVSSPLTLAAGALGIQAATSSQNGYASTNQITGSIGISVDGLGVVVGTGSKGFVTIPYNCTITNWYVSADISGSIQFDIKRSGTSIIGAGNKPLLSTAISGNAAVSGWTSATVTAGDILEWYVDTATTITNATVTLKIIK